MADDANTRGQMYVQTIAKTTDGAKALSYLMNRYMNLFTSNFSDNATQAAYLNGRRAVGLDVKQILGDDLFFQVIKTQY